MKTIRKTYKTQIQDAEDFGLFFNCLTRRFLWDYDYTLLELIHRILDQYLSYFSKRTLICSIRDFSNGSDSVFCECHKDVPEGQAEEYNGALKRMVKRYLAIELNGSTDKNQKRRKIQELASDGEFTAHYRNERQRMFPSKEAFEEWVYANQLDAGENSPLWEGNLLPVKKDFLPDFAALCLAAEQYSFGRLSYMPLVCREFIWKNSVLLSDEWLERISTDVENQLTEQLLFPDRGSTDELQEWESFVQKLRGELVRREWTAKAAEIIRNDYDWFEDEIHRMIGAAQDTEEDCIDVWNQLDGIYRYLTDRKNGCGDKKEYKRLIRWGKRYLAKKAKEIWERDNGWQHTKVGPYYRQVQTQEKGLEE